MILGIRYPMAHIDPADRRAAWWQDVFGGLSVEIESPLPHRGNLPGFAEPQEVYKLKLSALTPEQRALLVRHLARVFELPLREVEADLDREGVPILAEGVAVTFDARLLL